MLRFTKGELKPYSYFLGLNRRADHNTFVWDDFDNTTVPLSSHDYRNWDYLQPRPAREHTCVISSQHWVGDHWHGKWKTWQCSSPRMFFCKKPAVPSGALPFEFSSTPWPSECGPYWVQEPITRACFRLGPERSRFDDAKDQCLAWGSQLMSVHSATEQAAILAYSQQLINGPIEVWLGGSLFSTINGWEWYDRTPMNYINWKHGFLSALSFPFSLAYDGVQLLRRIAPVGETPFSTEYLQPLRPIETDPKTRDSVLKQGFHVSKIPDNIDAIIIGSGIGAMSTAVLLTRMGNRVLVLEQHDQAGGCCHTFVENGYEFDTGIHYIGRLGNKKMPFRAYIDQLTGGQVDWVQMDDAFDYIIFDGKDGRKDYPMASGKNEFWDNLYDSFPEEDHEAITRYRQLVQAIIDTRKCLLTFKTMPFSVVQMLRSMGSIPRISSYFGAYAAKTPKDVNEELGVSAELASVLNYGCNNAGGLPDELSFSMLAILTSHYERGAFYPRGGASEIAFHMIPIIESNGGKVLVRARVTEILVDDNNAAYGVRVRVGKGSSFHDIYAPIVVSDAGVMNTFTKLLPRPVAERSRYFKFTKIGPGRTAMYLFVGLNGSQEELKLPAGNYWIFSDQNYTPVIREFLSKSADEAAKGPIPAMFVSFPSAKDPTFAERHPGKSTCLIGVMCNYEWFEPFAAGKVKHRGSEYDGLKMEFGRSMWEQLLRIFPRLDGREEYFDVGTPLSNNFYLSSTKGELYGLHHNVSRFTDDNNIDLRPETDIAGLYLTGQDIFTCGFTGAAYGGLACAGAILNRSTFFDLFRFTSYLQRQPSP